MPVTEYEQGHHFPGVIGRTADESSPAWRSPVRAREGLAERLVHRARRHRFRSVRLLWWADRYTGIGCSGRERASLQQHAHHCAVLTEPIVHRHGTEPPQQRHGVCHRVRDGLSGLRRQCSI